MEISKRFNDTAVSALFKDMSESITDWRRSKEFVTPEGISGNLFQTTPDKTGSYPVELGKADLFLTTVMLRAILLSNAAEAIRHERFQEAANLTHKAGEYPIAPHFVDGAATDKEAMLGKLMLVVSEVGEAGEAVMENNPELFAEELADTFIRLFDICGACKIDIGTEIIKKMQVNENRPIKHGKKCLL
jgi:NTP pyrophosphatase (non-canonical NTP hydrolase)